ncbi:hypothetical protein [Sinomicrobium weinanense]|uniref:Lipoprotein n=1 Tax=Sinomicrobium weinanense TaxID=2842200 RepID=A0A926JTD9_9FLAO|nr:hypothetical protein [Sinomicrobium weinanense]MBC9796902.1 hypothetical protein [Sinomicrobium weinanense]MBU3124210.1 hypothetical protein [Sinomicrobium weinanense]
MKHLFPFIILALILSGCHRKQTAPEYGQQIMYEVFPALMDSVCKGLYEITPPPPPPPPVSIHADSSEIAEALAEYEKIIAGLKPGSKELVIAIMDSIYPPEPGSKNELVAHFASLNLSPDTTDIYAAYKVDPKKLKNNKKIRFRYRSEFPKYNALKGAYNFDLMGIIEFSGIQFDTTGSYGVFRSDLYCGELCGEGLWIFIRKVKDQWIIDRIKVIYVS